nr:unnamed protein product [Callosobruchus analis]
MSPLAACISLALLAWCPSVAEPATEFVEASDGSAASLPCDLTPAASPDRLGVVLWYRGTEEAPIYKYDARNAGHPQHWAQPELQNRFFLRILDDRRAVMSISPAKQNDETIFHCRVDFQKSPTRITHVNLTIIDERKLSCKRIAHERSLGSIKGGVVAQEEAPCPFRPCTVHKRKLIAPKMITLTSKRAFLVNMCYLFKKKNFEESLGIT